MRSPVAVATALALSLAACGGASSEPAVSSPSPVPDPTLEPAEMTPGGQGDGADDEGADPADAPDELALVDTDVALHGVTESVVSPGEMVTLDYLLHNGAKTARSIRIQPIGADDVRVELSVSSIRLPAGTTMPILITVTVPEDVASGDVLSFELVAVSASDVDRRASTDIRLVIAEGDDARPSVLDTTAETETNEKVIVYVVRSASGDLDGIELDSLRILGGGFRASSVTASRDGTITYQPFNNVTGGDMVLFELCNASGRCDTATLSVDVVDH